MCGIAGLWAPDLESHERLGYVHGMLARLGTRGPDGLAVFDVGGAALGITRLAIVAPHLPARVFGADHGEAWAVVNGEFYNHATLLDDLRTRGHDVPEAPDTALVPHLYEAHGPEFPRALDGMFAIAVWDPARALLLLARDRAGEKPLFWCRDGRRIAFASEPGALLALPWMRRTPDAAALGRYLAHGCFAHGDTAWHEVHVVPPGHVVQLDAARAHAERYWNVWDAPDPAAAALRGDGPVIERTHDVLARAVRSRVPAETACGVFLSGGIDSGLVAALLARAGVRVPAFSLRVAGEGYDEADVAAATARHVGLEHHAFPFGLEQAAAALEFASRMDQPLGDPSVLPTWALAREASRQVKVVLTGEGADELFAGYPTYLGHRWARWADAVPAPLVNAARAWASRRPKANHLSLPVLIERFLSARGTPPLDRHLAWFGTAPAAEAFHLLAPALRDEAGPGSTRGHLARAAHALARTPHGGTPRHPSLTAYQVLDFQVYLGGGLLTKVDRCTMAHGLESRAPFLDPALIGWALGLQERARLRGSTGKWVLKALARRLLPAAVVARRKQGFSPPFSAWARGPWRPMLEDLLSPARVRRAGVLDPDAVQRLLASHVSGAAERGRTVWAVTSLQLWAEHWLLQGPEPLGTSIEPAQAAIATRR